MPLVCGGAVTVPNQRATKKSCNLCPAPGAFSPSQIKLFAYGCQRKWAFRHILNLAEPEQTFQVLGKEVHRHNEDYLKRGVIPPRDTKAGEIAHVGLDRLPQPSPHHRVEEHLYIDRKDGFLMHGFADLIDTATCTVHDFKTTSSFQWTLSAEELATDPQALIYGMWLHDHTQTTSIRLHWMYYKTRAPYSLRSVTTELSAGQLEDHYAQHVLAPARMMREIRQVADPITFDPNELPGNAAGCNAYGGCPYRSQCNLHVTETFGMLFSQKLKARMEEAQKVDVTPCEVIAQGVVPPDAPEPVIILAEDDVCVAQNATTNATPTPSSNAGETQRKRGRPKKSEPSNAQAADNSYSLCVNTIPLKSEVALLSEIVAPIVKALSEQLGVPYYRLAKEAEYGRADALLLTAFCEAAPELRGYIYADKRCADTAALLSHLEASAQQVFRGGF
jgi:hypothetical protein